MFLSLENTLINLDSVARIDYLEPKNNPTYIQITYKTGVIEILKSVKWEEFQFIRQELLRKDCIIPIEGEVDNDDAN
jgi:hypothetical protein